MLSSLLAQASYAALLLTELRDELGCSMLHRVIQKKRDDHKADIVATLLDRGLDLARRDYQGSTG